MALKLKSFARRKMKGSGETLRRLQQKSETPMFPCQPLLRHQDPVFVALSTVLVGYLSNHHNAWILANNL